MGFRDLTLASARAVRRHAPLRLVSHHWMTFHIPDSGVILPLPSLLPPPRHLPTPSAANLVASGTKNPGAGVPYPRL